MRHETLLCITKNIKIIINNKLACLRLIKIMSYIEIEGENREKRVILWVLTVAHT